MNSFIFQHNTSILRCLLLCLLFFPVFKGAIAQNRPQTSQTSSLSGKQDWLKKFPHMSPILKRKLSEVFDQKSNAYTQSMLSLQGINLHGDNLQALLYALQKSNLTKLFLRYNKINTDGVRALADVLPKSKITKLYLWSNQIKDTGAKALARALPQSKVTVLNLGNNQIGDSAAKSLAAVLPQSKITKLYLWSNQIRSEGAEALARALPRSKVSVLDLGYNQIGGAGGKALSERLKNLYQLKKLNLAFLGIGGARQIAMAKLPPNLKVLNLSRNYIADKAMKILVQQLPQGLEELIVENSVMGPVGIKLLQNLQRQRPNLRIIHE